MDRVTKHVSCPSYLYTNKLLVPHIPLPQGSLTSTLSKSTVSRESVRFSENPYTSMSSVSLCTNDRMNESLDVGLPRENYKTFAFSVETLSRVDYYYSYGILTTCKYP